MSTPPTYALEIDQGDDELVQISGLQADGTTPLDLSGCKLWFYVKEAPRSTTALITKDSAGNGITITNAATGEAEVEIENTDTASLDSSLLDRKLRWELQVLDGASKITTLARGTIVIHKELVTEIA